MSSRETAKVCSAVRRRRLGTQIEKIADRDCKLFSQSHCRQLVYTFPDPSPRCYNTHCTRNIVTHHLQFCIVNYFHNILCAMLHFFLQCTGSVRGRSSACLQLTCKYLRHPRKSSWQASCTSQWRERRAGVGKAPMKPRSPE